MRTSHWLGLVLGLWAGIGHTLNAQHSETGLPGQLTRLAEQSERILDPSQRGLMNQVAWKIARIYGQQGGIEIALVDLDNSTISQLAEVWLQAALLYYGIDDIRVISGGLRAEGLQVEAIYTLEEWGFGVVPDESQSSTTVAIDYGEGEWNLFAKNIDPLKHADLSLFVDDHCEEELHAETLAKLNYVKVVLGSSPGCIEQGEYQFAAVNRDIAAKMFYLVRRLEANLVQQKKIGKQRRGQLWRTETGTNFFP